MSRTPTLNRLTLAIGAIGALAMGGLILLLLAGGVPIGQALVAVSAAVVGIVLTPAQRQLVLCTDDNYFCAPE